MLSDHPEAQAIRELIDRWTEASERSDYAALEPLMHPDVLFLTTGDSLNRDQFRIAFLNIIGLMDFESQTTVQEIEIDGELAFARNYISVRITPKPASDSPAAQAEAEARVTERKGHVLSIYKRSPSGQWQLYRDANMMTV
jgi:ketosteroid isomerase-like protein